MCADRVSVVPPPRTTASPFIVKGPSVNTVQLDDPCAVCELP
jgi:hypothetical protein